MSNLQRILIPLGGLVAVILQLVLSPQIAVFSAQPNFLLVYVLIVAVVRGEEAGVVLPFLLGFAYDLMSVGPLGAMALLCLLASLAASRVSSLLGNDNITMPLLIFTVSTLLVEVLYGGILMIFGLSGNLLEALVYRALPITLYDCVLGLIFYPLMMRLMIDGAQDRKMRSPRLR